MSTHTGVFLHSVDNIQHQHEILGDGIIAVTIRLGHSFYSQGELCFYGTSEQIGAVIAELQAVLGEAQAEMAKEAEVTL